MEIIEPIKIRQNTIVQQVMEQIKELVASGNIKPGDKVPTEVEMARIFGVSRSSIREAIKIFSYLGVFDTQTRRGTVLCRHSSITNEALTWTFLLGSKEISDLIELRKVIEQECWMLLCDNCRKDKTLVEKAIDELGEEIKAMSIARERQQEAELMEADFRFHQKVIDYSENAQFRHLFQTLKSFTCEAIMKSNAYRNFSVDIVEEHNQILKSLKKEDTARVIELFRTHIENLKERIISLNAIAKGQDAPHP
jgi:GntR family transcriptional regulator, transcriptional repressor for pyruvate dehydrogenase complex